MDTTAIFLPTEKMMDDIYYADVQRILKSHRDYTDDLWSPTIPLGGDYELDADYSTSPAVELNNVDDTNEALSQSRSWINNHSDLFSDYDVVIVCDTRGDFEYIGRAYVGSAGDKGLGYVALEAGSDTACHELLHCYGADHSEYRREDTTVESSDHLDTCCVMGRPDWYNCDIERNSYPRGDWVGSCTRNRVRDHLDELS